MVLGCNGQDGSLMCKSLLEKNFKVIGVTRKKIKAESNLPRLGILQDVEIENGDIRSFSDISNVLEKHQPERVFNLAAESSVGQSFLKPNRHL